VRDHLRRVVHCVFEIVRTVTDYLLASVQHAAEIGYRIETETHLFLWASKVRWYNTDKKEFFRSCYNKII
jgi:hypothetical protein